MPTKKKISKRRRNATTRERTYPKCPKMSSSSVQWWHERPASQSYKLQRRMMTIERLRRDKKGKDQAGRCVTTFHDKCLQLFQWCNNLRPSTSNLVSYITRICTWPNKQQQTDVREAKSHTSNVKGCEMPQFRKRMNWLWVNIPFTWKHSSSETILHECASEWHSDPNRRWIELANAVVLQLYNRACLCFLLHLCAVRFGCCNPREELRHPAIQRHEIHAGILPHSLFSQQRWMTCQTT